MPKLLTDTASHFRTLEATQTLIMLWEALKCFAWANNRNFCLPRLVAGVKGVISWNRLESIHKFLCLYLPRYLKSYPELLSFHHQHRYCSRFVNSKTEIRATTRVILVSRRKCLQYAMRHIAACSTQGRSVETLAQRKTLLCSTYRDESGEIHLNFYY
jgi:hypothetical protein